MASNARAGAPREEIRSQRVTLPGGRFSYLEAGPRDGELAICLHGFPDHPWCYRDLLPALAAQGYRAVAPWLRGYAPSTLDGPFDMTRIAADVDELAQTLSPGDDYVLVGHDWGAVATYLVLGRHGERVRRAVTMAVPHAQAWLDNASLRQLRKSWYMLFFQLRGISDAAVARNDFRFIDRLWSAWSPGYAPDSRYMSELKRTLWLSLPRPLMYYRAMLQPDRAALRDVQRIRTPTLYLHGENDGCVGFEMAQGQERYFDVEFDSELIPRAGHFLQLEQPDLIAARIGEWFGPATPAAVSHVVSPKGGSPGAT